MPDFITTSTKAELIGLAITMSTLLVLSIWAIVTDFRLTMKIEAAKKFAADNHVQFSDETKLKIARHSLGQIANRESIREVRKLANKALKETK